MVKVSDTVVAFEAYTEHGEPAKIMHEFEIFLGSEVGIFDEHGECELSGDFADTPRLDKLKLVETLIRCNDELLEWFFDCPHTLPLRQL